MDRRPDEQRFVDEVFNKLLIDIRRGWWVVLVLSIVIC